MMEGLPPCKTPERCRFKDDGPSISTCVYYPPVYDRNGMNVNPDRNLRTQPMKCIHCGQTCQIGLGSL